MKTVVKKSKWTIIALLAVVMCVWLGIGMFATASQDKPTIEKVEASLYDNIAFHYYTSVPEGYSNPYMKFELGGRTYTETEVRKEDNYYIFDFDGIAPQDINAEVTATLYATKSSAEKQCDTIKKSVDRYCEELLGHTAAELGIINEKYTAMKKLIADLRSYSSEVQQAGGKEPTLAYTFTLNKKVNINDVVLKLTKVDSGETYVAWDFEQQADKDGKAVYTAYFDAIAPVECRTALSLQLFIKGEASGSAQNYGFDTYINSVQNSDDTNAKLARAYYQYGVSAMGYAVNIPFDETYDAVGLNVELKSDSGKYYKRPVAEDNCVSLSGIPNDTYTVTTDVFGIEQEIGVIIVDSKHVDYPLDLGKVFLNSSDIKSGDIDYEFASNAVHFKHTARAHGILKTSSDITGAFSITAKYKISEEDVMRQLQEKEYLSFGIFFKATEGRADGLGIYMDKSGNMYLRDTKHVANSKYNLIGNQFGKIKNGVWTHSKYSEALTGDGLWVRHERTSDGIMKVYLGTTKDNLRYICDIGNYKNMDVVQEVWTQFNYEEGSSGYAASIEDIEVSVAKEVHIMIDEMYDAEGLNVTFKSEVTGTVLTGTVDSSHRITLLAEPGDYRVSTKIFGLTQSLGTLSITDDAVDYKLDMAKAFMDCEDIVNGDMDFDFVTNSATFHDTAKAHGYLKVSTGAISEPFSVTAKYKVSEAEVLDEAGIPFNFGIYFKGTEGANDGMSFYKNKNEVVLLRDGKYTGGYGTVLNYFGTISNGVWNHSDYSRALTGDGLWIKYERTEDGTMKVYMGTTKDNLTYIQDNGTYKNTDTINELRLQFNYEKGSHGYSASIENVEVVVASEIAVTMDEVYDAEGLQLTLESETSGKTLVGTANESNTVLFHAEPGIYNATIDVFGITQTLGTITVEEGVDEYEVDLSKAFLDCADLTTGDITYNFVTNSATFQDTAKAHGYLKVSTGEISGPFSVTAKYKVSAAEVIDEAGLPFNFGIYFKGTEGANDGMSFYKNKNEVVLLRDGKYTGGYGTVLNYFGTISNGVWNHSDYSRALTGDGLWIKYERTEDGTMKVYMGTSKDNLTYIQDNGTYKNTDTINELRLQFNYEKGSHGYSASIENVEVKPYNTKVTIDKKYDADGLKVSFESVETGEIQEQTVDADNSITMMMKPGTYNVTIDVFGITQSLGTLAIEETTTQYSLDVTKAFLDCADIKSGDITYDFATNSATFHNTAKAHGIIKISTGDLSGPFSVTAKYKVSEAEVLDEKGIPFNFGIYFNKTSGTADGMSFYKNKNEVVLLRDGKYSGKYGTVENYFGTISNDVWTHSDYSRALTGDGLWIKYERTADGTMKVYMGTTKDNMTFIKNNGTYKNTDTINELKLQFNFESKSDGYTASIEHVEITNP